MQFTNSENEIKNAIEVLDKLVQANSSNTMEAIRHYKNHQEIDMFTSYRLKKQLKKLTEQI